MSSQTYFFFVSFFLTIIDNNPNPLLLPLLPPTAMQSQGSTSSQPSFDSLSSSDSLLFSDSEQAEEDTDVFLTDGSSSVIISGVGGAAATEDRGSESPGSQWMCGGYTDKEEEEESYRSESSSKVAHISLDETDPTGQIPKSQGDLLFAQKVKDLVDDEEG